MLKDDVFTLEEVSQHLRVSIEAVQQEVASGRLRAFDVAGFIRVCEADLNLYKTETSAVVTRGKTRQTTAVGTQLNAAPDFPYTWPDGKVEQYTEVREGLVFYGGKEHHVKLGFTIRRSAGKLRRRCLVLVDRYAAVEFVAADEQSTGRMASIIKGRDRKQLPVGATPPPEYQGVPVGPYHDVVVGPRASNGLAVVCDGIDFDAMVKHALVRYQFRMDRN